MSRFVLTHHVVRASRDMSTERSAHGTLDDAHLAALVVAAFTSVGNWRQEIEDTLTGDRWLRTRDTDWVRCDR